jgi:hypothetical protein
MTKRAKATGAKTELARSIAAKITTTAISVAAARELASPVMQLGSRKSGTRK